MNADTAATWPEIFRVPDHHFRSALHAEELVNKGEIWRALFRGGLGSGNPAERRIRFGVEGEECMRFS